MTTQLLRKGCTRYLTHVIDIEDNTLILGDIPVVQQFLDVFPYDLPRLPPHHDIEFTIELVGEEDQTARFRRLSHANDLDLYLPV
ncbi:unnamed protein product [Prunus armeniaca]